MKKHVLLKLLFLLVLCTTAFVSSGPKKAFAYTVNPIEIPLVQKRCDGGKKTAFVPFVESAQLKNAPSMSLYSTGSPAAPIFDIVEGTTAINGSIGMYTYICPSATYSQANVVIEISVGGQPAQTVCIPGLGCGSINGTVSVGNVNKGLPPYYMQTLLNINTNNFTAKGSPYYVDVIYKYRGYYDNTTDPALPNPPLDYPWRITINVAAANDPLVWKCRVPNPTPIHIKTSDVWPTDTDPVGSTCPSGDPGGGPGPSPTGGATVDGTCVGDQFVVTALGSGIVGMDLVVDGNAQSGTVNGGGTSATYQIGGAHTISAFARLVSGATSSTWSGSLDCNVGNPPPPPPPPAFVVLQQAYMTGSCTPFRLSGNALGTAQVGFLVQPDGSLTPFYGFYAGVYKVYANGIEVTDAVKRQVASDDSLSFFWSAYYAQQFNGQLNNPFFPDFASFKAWYLTYNPNAAFNYEIDLPARLRTNTNITYTVTALVELFGVPTEISFPNTSYAFACGYDHPAPVGFIEACTSIPGGGMSFTGWAHSTRSPYGDDPRVTLTATDYTSLMPAFDKYMTEKAKPAYFDKIFWDAYLQRNYSPYGLGARAGSEIPIWSYQQRGLGTGGLFTPGFMDSLTIYLDNNVSPLDKNTVLNFIRYPWTINTPTSQEIYAYNIGTGPFPYTDTLSQQGIAITKGFVEWIGKLNSVYTYSTQLVWTINGPEWVETKSIDFASPNFPTQLNSGYDTYYSTQKGNIASLIPQLVSLGYLPNTSGIATYSVNVPTNIDYRTSDILAYLGTLVPPQNRFGGGNFGFNASFNFPGAPPQNLVISGTVTDSAGIVSGLGMGGSFLGTGGVVPATCTVPPIPYTITPTTTSLSINETDPTVTKISYAHIVKNNSVGDMPATATTVSHITINGADVTSAGYPLVIPLRILTKYGDSEPIVVTNLVLPSKLLPGSQLCVYIVVLPYSNDPAQSPNPGFASTAPGMCKTVTAKPFIKVVGADVRVGGSFASSSPTCNVPNGSGSINTSGTSSGSTFSGSSAQFGVFALLGINGFYSASQRTTTSPRPPKGLTFSNTAGTYGGNFGGNTCITDYYGTTQTAATTQIAFNAESDFIPGKNQYRVFGSKKIGSFIVPQGVQAALYLEGDLFIDGNIEYSITPSSGSAALNYLPFLAVIVRGNIRIASNVTRLDGMYVAQPDNGATSQGRIYTCAQNNKLYDKNELSTECNKQLVVNGALIAQKIKFLRTIGNVNEDKGEIPDPGDGKNTKAAEVINYTPEMWLAPSPLVDGNGGADTSYDSVYSLPPVY